MLYSDVYTLVHADKVHDRRQKRHKKITVSTTQKNEQCKIYNNKTAILCHWARKRGGLIISCYTLAKKVAYVAKLNVAFWLMYCDVAYMAT